MGEKIYTGHFIALTGTSGAGQDTLRTHIQRVFGSKLCYPISYTTRERRPGEQEGIMYHYVSRDTFIEMEKSGDFFETSTYGNNLYGMPISEVEERMQHNAILFRILDLAGFNAIRTRIPREHITLIFVDGGDWDSLRRRILARAPMDPSELQKRKDIYDLHRAQLRPEADYVIHNEDGKLDKAKEDIRKVIEEVITKVRTS